MARAKRSVASQDLSSFMCIVLMVIGVMFIVLIVNVVLIISNPENIRITSLIQSPGAWTPGQQELVAAQPFPFGNRQKEPVYVDVQKDHLVLYPSAEVVSIRDLERPGNAFERLLADVESKKNEEYVVLLARPGTASVFHRLKKAVLDRGIDLGWELFEADRPVEYDKAARASGRIR